jgi:hypothetical protein
MHGRVGPYERQSVTLQTYEERQSSGFPSPEIVESSKNLLCLVMCGGEIDQGYQDTEKPEDMNYQHNHFDCRQCSTDEDIDKDT